MSNETAGRMKGATDMIIDMMKADKPRLQAMDATKVSKHYSQPVETVEYWKKHFMSI